MIARMTERSANVRELLLPKEHGSWSLAFEPVALGLLVAPSVAGLALALAAAAGFFVRRPLKLAVTTPTDDPRHRPAQRWAAVLMLGAGITLVGAAALGTAGALWPLALAAPCGLLFLWFDLRQAMREAEAELAGSMAFALLPAAFATLAGWPVPAALALAVVMLARSVPTILTLRAYLRLGKGKTVNPVPVIAISSMGFILVALLAWRQLIPAVAVLVNAGFWLRTLWLVTSRRPDWPARHIGIMEAVLGVISLGVLTAAFHLSRNDADGAELPRCMQNRKVLPVGRQLAGALRAGASSLPTRRLHRSG